MIIGKKSENIEYKVIEIDLINVKTKMDLFIKVGESLYFPVIGENSWDAFYDWFRDLHKPLDKYDAINFVFKNCKNIEPTVKEMFIKLINDVIKNGLTVCDNHNKREILYFYELID